MSDFVSNFWPWYIAVIVIGSLVWLFYLVFSQSHGVKDKGHKIEVIEKDTQLKPDIGKALLAEAYGDDDAHIAVGPVSSGVALAMLRSDLVQPGQALEVEIYGERFRALVAVWPVLLVFTLVVVGIYRCVKRGIVRSQATFHLNNLFSGYTKICSDTLRSGSRPCARSTGWTWPSRRASSSWAAPKRTSTR